MESPYLRLFQQIPDYKFLKVFGCACFPHLWFYDSYKSVFHLKECVFIGFSGDRVSGNPASSNCASCDPAFGNPASNYPASVDPLSGNLASNNPASCECAFGNLASNNPSVENDPLKCQQ